MHGVQLSVPVDLVDLYEFFDTTYRLLPKHLRLAESAHFSQKSVILTHSRCLLG